MIENNVPLAVKKMKITNEGKETEESKELEDFANKMVNETEAYIKKLLALRGERIFIDNLIPYIINMEIFQVSYECHKIVSLVEKKKINEELLIRYLNMRLRILLDKALSSLEKIEDKESWTYVVIDQTVGKVKLDNLQAMYNEFMNMKRDIETNFLVNFLRQEHLANGAKNGK